MVIYYKSNKKISISTAENSANTTQLKKKNSSLSRKAKDSLENKES